MSPSRGAIPHSRDLWFWLGLVSVFYRGDAFTSAMEEKWQAASFLSTREHQICSESLLETVRNNEVQKLKEKLADGKVAECWTRFKAVLVETPLQVAGTALHLAADLGFLEIVEVLLAHNYDAATLADTCADEGKLTALMLAAGHGHAAVVKRLLEESGVRANFQNPGDGTTALIWAVQASSHEVVKMLLEVPDIDASTFSKKGWCALHEAAFLDDDEVVTMLLQSSMVDINVREQTDRGRPPLMLAVAPNPYQASTRKHQAKAVKALLTLGKGKIDVNLADQEDFSTPLVNAANDGKLFIVKLLLAVDGILINTQTKEKQTALTLAADKGRLEVVEELLKRPDLDVNVAGKGGKTALLQAISSEKTEVALTLLEDPRTEVDCVGEDGATALMSAIYHLNDAVAAAILTPAPGRADLSIKTEDDLTYFILAAKKGRVKVIEWLLQDGADVNDVDKDGKSALMYAIEMYWLEVVKAIVSAPNVDCNTMSKDGSSPLILASRKGIVEVLAVLLACPNIDIDATDKEGRTAFLVGAASGNLEIVHYLRNLEERDDCHVTDEEGNSAVALASANGELDILKFLRTRCGHDVHIISNKAACLPLVLAARNGHLDVVEYTMNHIFDPFTLTYLASKESHANPLEVSILAGQVTLMKYLLTTFSVDGKPLFYLNDLYAKDRTLLFSVVMATSRREEMATWLLSQWDPVFSALVNKVDTDGCTAVQLAVEQDNKDENSAFELVRIMLIAGAAAHVSGMKLKVAGNSVVRKCMESPLRIALRKGNYMMTKLLVDFGARPELDFLHLDLEGFRLALRMGVEYSLLELVQFLKTRFHFTWSELTESPRECKGDLKGRCGHPILNRAATPQMIHLLLDRQLKDSHSEKQEIDVEKSVALNATLHEQRVEVAATLLARNAKLRKEDFILLRNKNFGYIGDSEANHILDRIEEKWNHLHWCVAACDTHALSFAFNPSGPESVLDLLDQAAKDRDKTTPLDLAKDLSKSNCPNILAILHQLELMWDKQCQKDGRSMLVAIVAAIVSVGSLVIHIFFLRHQTFQKLGWGFMCCIMLLYCTMGVIIAVTQRHAKVSSRYSWVPIWGVIIGMWATIMGILIIVLATLTFVSERFRQRLRRIKKCGNNKRDRCWESLDCGLSWILLFAIFVVVIGGGCQDIITIGGIAHAVASTLPLFVTTPRHIVMAVRLVTGLTIIVRVVWVGLAVSPDDPPPPAALLLAITCFSLASADLPGAMVSVKAHSSVEMSQRAQEGAERFTANKLILGHAAMAAHGIEEALGLGCSNLSAGMVDPVEAMRREILRTGDMNDLENFKYIVEGTSGNPRDYPTAVATSLATGNYHGGELGPDDFDTGHAGRTLDQWMQVPEVVLARLSKAEFIAVRFYTSSSFPKINGPLRREVKPHPWAMVVFLLDRGIKKLRSVQAQVNPQAFAGKTTLWRGMKNLEVDVKEFAELGGTEMAPMSTTTNEDVARHYADSKVPLVFKYVVGGLKTGVSIQFLSLYPKEEEFLYAPLTFLSLKSHYEDDGTTILVVEPVMS